MTRRPLVMTGLVLAMLLAAIEATIVATAMPDIAAELGGFSLYGWVFSAYLLTQAVTTPVFGKLADMFGRKPVFMVGVALFLVGSALCALAPTMGWLVAARLVQGFGAGAVLPIAVTLAGDLYTLAERGRVQGYMASVWGVSSIVGPLAGGLIVEQLGWPWIFWLNLPFGLVAMAMIFLFLHEERELRRPRLDLLGATLLMVGLAALLLALTREAWGLLAAAAVVLGAFVVQERRAADPIVHLELFRLPIIGLGNVAVLMVGFAMMGLIGFMPTYVQGVLGGTALEGGFALSAMCVGWPLSSVVAGRLLPRLGPRPLVRVGSVVAFLGTLEIALLASRGSLWAGAGSFLVGVGFGILNTSFLVAIQSSVAWERRGMATAANMLMRNLGNAVGRPPWEACSTTTWSATCRSTGWPDASRWKTSRTWWATPASIRPRWPPCGSAWRAACTRSSGPSAWRSGWPWSSAGAYPRSGFPRKKKIARAFALAPRTYTWRVQFDVPLTSGAEWRWK